VSTDIDFTRLVQRIRESGLTVYGFGQRSAVKSFVAACDKFIYIENFTSAAAPASRIKAPQPKGAAVKTDAELADLLRSAVEATTDKDGWAHLDAAGGLINKRRPDFDARSYGYAKLSSANSSPPPACSTSGPSTRTTANPQCSTSGKEPAALRTPLLPTTQDTRVHGSSVIRADDSGT
jgi:uncharacterized LabA/DUF88 family protein